MKTYGEVLQEYEFHPESKCADARGNVCSKQTTGPLHRRHIQAESLTYIGKESNKLEDVQSALIHSAQEVYTIYHDPRRDEWQTKILPALKKAPLTVFVRMSCLSRRAIMDLRAERSRPHPKNQEHIEAVLREMRYL